MSVEDQFDIAAQDRRAETAKKAKTVPPYVYDRDAVIAAAAEPTRESWVSVADAFDRYRLAAEQVEIEVPEVPGKVHQEPEITIETTMPPIASADCSRAGSDG